MAPMDLADAVAILPAVRRLWARRSRSEVVVRATEGVGEGGRRTRAVLGRWIGSVAAWWGEGPKGVVGCLLCLRSWLSRVKVGLVEEEKVELVGEEAWEGWADWAREPEWLWLAVARPLRYSW